MSRPERLRASAKRAEPWLYGVFATALTLVFARTFYGYMRVQTGGEWSAPLDDVFIHFNYARSIARGYPFEWSEGNGFSTGTTSLTYPLVLALGYWALFRGPLLVVWAGIVACASMVAFLLGARRLFDALPFWAKYLAPLGVYSVGALGWAVFSGMEIALYLGLWSLSLAAMLAAIRETNPRSRVLREWLLGASGVLLVLTRPEGAASVAILGAGAAIAGEERSLESRLRAFLRATGLGFSALFAKALVNQRLTGESLSNAAIANLFVHHPLLTLEEKITRYRESVEYLMARILEHHFADVPRYGLVVLALATIPFASSRLRGLCALLFASSLSWLALVALGEPNAGLNEVHAMPAVAWLMLAASLGVGLLLTPPLAGESRAPSRWGAWVARATLAILLVGTFVQHQAPRMREQIWLFARASRNVRDHQTTIGRVLRRLEPPPRRVLVGEAGAITYAADLPALHLTGLGGLGKLPFARASTHGIGASLELLERLAPDERPDYFALDLSSWGTFPSWLGSYVIGIPVQGSVTGESAETVIYRASYRSLGTAQFPRTLRAGEEIVDALDVGDLVSEREHAYEACPERVPRCPSGSSGRGDCQVDACGLTEARFLADPVHPGWEMFDAGRHIHSHQVERFRLKRRAEAPARLIVRTVGDRATTVGVFIDGEASGDFEIPLGGWQEMSLALPETGEEFTVELVPRAGGWVHHHAWVVQPR